MRMKKKRYDQNAKELFLTLLKTGFYFLKTTGKEIELNQGERNVFEPLYFNPVQHPKRCRVMFEFPRG